MIATHNPKTLNSKLKQAPICAVVAPAHPHFLHSGNVHGRELFAAAQNAADTKAARGMAENAGLVETSIPQPTDGKIKQLLLPYLDDYVALSPVPSLKIMDELYERTKELRESKQPPYLFSKKAIIQDSAVASNNHGDPVAAHGGKLWVISQHVYPVKPEKLLTFSTDGVLITADVQGLQVSSNYVQSGMPAITAIGGLVHVLERQTGQKLSFAVGFGETHDTIHQTAKKTGTVKGGKYTIDLNTEETTVNTMVYIFVATDNPAPVQDAAQKIKRIAGGTAWNITADPVTTEHQVPIVRWLNPLVVDTAPHADTLYAYIEQKRTNPATTAIVQNGYVMLHEPFEHPYSRADSKMFAWAEPVHCMCSVEYAITSLWQLKIRGNFLCWWATL